jgi:hypothetical protein
LDRGNFAVQIAKHRLGDTGASFAFVQDEHVPDPAVPDVGPGHVGAGVPERYVALGLILGDESPAKELIYAL